MLSGRQAPLLMNKIDGMRILPIIAGKRHCEDDCPKDVLTLIENLMSGADSKTINGNFLVIGQLQI